MNDFKELDSLVKNINKKIGEGSIYLIEDGQNYSNVERWPIESMNINDVICGGIPKGRILEIYGGESNGKSTLACYLGGQIQKQDGVVAYIDVEQSLDAGYAKTLGLDISKCIFCQPESGEHAMDIAIALAESEKVDLIIVDSVAALIPKSELEGEMSDQQMGAQARLMGKALRKITPILGKTKTTILFLNQNRMKIGVLYGDPTTQPGGLALKFYTSIRLEVRRTEWIEEGTGDNKIRLGMVFSIKATKNKVGIPYKKREVKVIFGKGLQVEEEFIDFALEYQVIERRGTWYFYNENRIAQGKDNVIEHLKNNAELFEKIKKETKEKMNKHVVVDKVETEKIEKEITEKEVLKEEE